MKRIFGSEFGDMTHSKAFSQNPQFCRSVPFVELRQFLPSQIAIVSPFVDQLMHFIARFRNMDGSEQNIETALREALANAIVHGNQEDLRKLVWVACRCTTDGEVSITVREEGRGFNATAVLPTAPENRLLTHGRGIYLMKMLMDEACFEGGGRVVYMRKHRTR
jgi:serine/threonine-protein kinase RsbW